MGYHSTMPDSSTITTTTGYGSRITNSLKGIPFGIILFLASFVILYTNEGRVDLSSIAVKSVVIDPTVPHPEQNGTLVSASGPVQTKSLTGDKLYLKPGAYLLVDRTVEMYAWVEHEQTETHQALGGSQTTTTTYTYTQEWTTDPGTDFHEPQGHGNPPIPLPSVSVRAPDAMVGIYSVDMNSVDLPTSSPLLIDSSMVSLPHNTTLQNGFLFQGKGSITQPDIGDIRISYAAVPNNLSGTVMGILSGQSIQQFLDTHGNRLYRIFAVPTKDAAVQTLHQEYKLSLWIFRGIGFVMMWLGLGLILAPVSILLDVVPLFGEITGAITMLLTFVAAVILSIVTILVSEIVHTPLTLAVTVLVVIIAGILFFLHFRKKPA